MARVDCGPEHCENLAVGSGSGRRIGPPGLQVARLHLRLFSDSLPRPFSRMDHLLRMLKVSDANIASELAQHSFLELVANDWELEAREDFLSKSTPEALGRALQSPAFAAGALSVHDTMVGFILMPTPSLLGMLFVQPTSLRLGIGKQLWEQARSHIEVSFPDVKTVELNATPYALDFYRSVGFVPISAEFRRGGCRATRMACWLPARALRAEVV